MNEIESLKKGVRAAEIALCDARECLAQARNHQKSEARDARPPLPPGCNWDPQALCEFSRGDLCVEAYAGFLSIGEAGDSFAELQIDAIRSLIKVYDENPDLR